MSIAQVVSIPNIAVSGCGETVDKTSDLVDDVCAFAEGEEGTLASSVPVRTGALASSAYVSCGSDSVEVGFSINYAVYVPAAGFAVDAVASSISSYAASAASQYMAEALREVLQECDGLFGVALTFLVWGFASSQAQRVLRDVETLTGRSVTLSRYRSRRRRR